MVLIPLIGLVVAGCRTVRERPEPTGFDPLKLQEIDVAVEAAIAEGECPGAVLWLEHDGEDYSKAYGHRAIKPGPEPMTEGTVFDIASLTKVFATAPAVMWLWERDRLDLDAPVGRYLEEFSGNGRETVTVRQLLTHTSGLPAGIDWTDGWTGYEEGIERAIQAPLQDPPGEQFRYSDVNYLLLGEMVRRLTDRPLDQLVEEEFYEPLGMTSTGFRPTSPARASIAPTEPINGRWLRGRVHDPTARQMGGVAGHAGLFSTAADLARFCRMMVGGGELDGVRVLQQETVEMMTRDHTPGPVESARGLGWDIDSPYSSPRGEGFSSRSYGHTGFTGGSVWIAPESDTSVIFLTHRVHPDGEGNVVPLRRRLGTLAAEAVKDGP